MRQEVRPATRLLGAHVRRGAHRGARLREAVTDANGASRVVGSSPHYGVSCLGQAEIQDLDAAVWRDQDIVGLQIPVDNAGGVRGRQAIRNLHREIQQLAR